MNSTTPEDRWLDVLSGEAQPTDRATEQAAQMRGYFQRQADMDCAEADEASVRRRMNMLRARGAFDAKQTAQPAPTPSPVRRLLSWLFPPQGGSHRYAIVAGLMAAVLLVPLLRDQAQDDGPTFKRFPASTVITAADPDARALEIRDALQALGVDAQITLSNAEASVQATVSEDLRLAAQSRLAAYGVALPADGRLRLSIRPVH